MKNIIAFASTWSAATTMALLRASAEDAAMVIISGTATTEFCVLSAGFITAGDELWDLVAATIQPDPDLAAMLAACPTNATLAADLVAVLEAAVA